uniref:Uncharacterized protein AlNc14C43G3591 n=1 Tax=Albugo laibachii Nc14 TaxID=890382 RepID=F0WA47_9STRA|nr:conserved hypothetical protein [Albugo laibachii Nc14]|eukprot:CCA18017.1 conserved hypothetical protein [Albugo laibachii Nc14]
MYGTCESDTKSLSLCSASASSLTRVRDRYTLQCAYDSIPPNSSSKKTAEPTLKSPENLQLSPPSDCIDKGWGQMHLVRHGDTLESIAALYHTTTHLIRKANRQHFPLGERGNVCPGLLLHIFKIDTKDQNASQIDQKQIHPIDRPPHSGTVPLHALKGHSIQKYNSHEIKCGDTLESICADYKLTMIQLMEMNRGRFIKGQLLRLQEGQSVIVPDAEATERAYRYRHIGEVVLKKQIHVVEKGETAEDIARQYHMTIDQLRAFNRSYFPKGFRGNIFPGYNLVVNRQNN